MAKNNANTAVIEEAKNMVEELKSQQFDNQGFQFEFEEGAVQSSENIPYAQIQSPQPDMESGILILEEQAEIAGFKPDDNWKLAEFNFTNGTKSEVKSGYISKKLRFCIAAMSQIEVEENVEGRGWQYKGLAYANGMETQLGKNAKSLQNFRDVQRMLVFFLDKDNQPLHENAIQLKIRGGLRTTLNREVLGTPGSRGADSLLEFVGKAYAEGVLKATGKKIPTKLTKEYSNYVGIAVELGSHKNGATASFLCPKVIDFPALGENSVGSTEECDRTYNGFKRSIKRNFVEFGRVFLSKSNPTRNLIEQAKELYPEFTKKTVQSAKPITATGTFDINTCQWQDNGNVLCEFTSSDGTFLVELTPEQSETLNHEGIETMSFTLKGTIQSGRIKAKTIAVNHDSTENGSSDEEYFS